MPKEKTHKGLAKRVKVTAKRKVKRHKAGTGHLMSGKTAKRRRNLRKSALVKGPFAAKALRELNA
jgi:large subunit ribosomal protein L35